MTKIVIGRPINNIALNGDEFLLDGTGTGDYMYFDTVTEAKTFLIVNTDCPLESIDNYFNFYETDNKDNEGKLTLL